MICGLIFGDGNFATQPSMLEIFTLALVASALLAAKFLKSSVSCSTDTASKVAPETVTTHHVLQQCLRVASGPRKASSFPLEAPAPAESPTSGAPLQRSRSAVLSQIGVEEREVKSILNKLTRDKFDKLYAQLFKLTVSAPAEADIMSVVAREVFAKATTQATYVDMYADICEKLQTDLSKGDTQATFKRKLLEQCQQSFYTHLKLPTIDDNLEYEERFEALTKYKTKMLGNVRLIGHLLCRRMLSPKIVFLVTDELVSIGSDCALETLAAFLTTVGYSFDQASWANHGRFNEVFVRLELLAEDCTQSARTRCLLKNVLELRQNAWQQIAEPEENVLQRSKSTSPPRMTVAEQMRRTTSSLN